MNSTKAPERAAIYRELHRDYLDRFNATRQIEWIVNGAVWAGVVLAGGQLAQHVDLHGWSTWVILRVGLYGGFFHFALWMYPIQCSEDADSVLADDYRLLTHQALLDKDLATDKGPVTVPQRTNRCVYKRFLGRFDWPLLECATTTFLIWSVLYFLKHVTWVNRPAA